MLTEVAQVTVDKRGGRLRHEHLSSVTRSCHAGGAVDIDAHVALVRAEWSPRVQADAHLHRTGRERLAPAGGGGKGGGRSLESEEERVALRVDLDAKSDGRTPRV